jgi:hypothetical protein
MIQYRKADGTIGEFNSDRLYQINIKDGKFVVTLKDYGYDEYDFWYSEIDDITELRI